MYFGRLRSVVLDSGEWTVNVRRSPKYNYTIQGECWAVTVVLNYAFILKQTKKINGVKSLAIMTYQVPNRVPK